MGVLSTTALLEPGMGINTWSYSDLRYIEHTDRSIFHYRPCTYHVSPLNNHGQLYGASRYGSGKYYRTKLYQYHIGTHMDRFGHSDLA